MGQAAQQRASTWQHDVREFMELAGVLCLPSGPSVPAFHDRHWIPLAKRLISEEYLELIQAINLVLASELHRDLAPLAKEMADVIYVVLYMANLLGIDMREVFTAVHESNMTKDGPGYVDPLAVIRAILEAQ